MKKKLLITIPILLVAVVAAVLCLTRLTLPGATTTMQEYNQAATAHGLAGNYISKNEILLADTIERGNGKTLVRYRIFSLADGYSAEDFLPLPAEQAIGRQGLTEVGSASAEFIGGNVKNIRNFRVMHDL